jgi:hypothetical protein
MLTTLTTTTRQLQVACTPTTPNDFNYEAVGRLLECLRARALTHAGHLPRRTHVVPHAVPPVVPKQSVVQLSTLQVPRLQLLLACRTSIAAELATDQPLATDPSVAIVARSLHAHHRR